MLLNHRRTQRTEANKNTNANRSPARADKEEVMNMHKVCQCDNCHFDEVDHIVTAYEDDQISRQEFKECMATLRDRRLKRKEKETQTIP